MFDSLDDLSTKLAATGYFIDPVMTQVVYLAARLKSRFSSRVLLARAKRN